MLQTPKWPVFILSVSSPEPYQAATQQKLSQARRAETAPGSAAPWSRPTLWAHLSRLHPLLSWIHWTSTHCRVHWGAESLSQCSLVVHNGGRWVVICFHSSSNIVAFQRDGIRMRWDCIAGSRSFPQSHVGEISYSVTLGQPWWKVGFARKSILLLWLMMQRTNEPHKTRIAWQWK